MEFQLIKITFFFSLVCLLLERSIGDPSSIAFRLKTMPHSSSADSNGRIRGLYFHDIVITARPCELSEQSQRMEHSSVCVINSCSYILVNWQRDELWNRVPFQNLRITNVPLLLLCVSNLCVRIYATVAMPVESFFFSLQFSCVFSFFFQLIWTISYALLLYSK